MQNVYSAAQSVLVWIGPHEAGSAQLFDSLYDTIAANAVCLQSRKSPALDGSVLREFQGLMERSYSRRTWIIQEILLAKNVRLFCGESSTPWHDFAAFHRERVQNASSLRPDLRQRYKGKGQDLQRHVSIRRLGQAKRERYTPGS